MSASFAAEEEKVEAPLSDYSCPSPNKIAGVLGFKIVG
jgi:hypothetical protein